MLNLLVLNMMVRLYHNVFILSMRSLEIVDIKLFVNLTGKRGRP
jgi:hypothetical protein